MDNFYAALAEITLKFKQLHEPMIHTYACERCGRRDGLDAVVPDDMWEEISGRSDGGGILCLWCMDELADRRGVGGEVSLHFCGRALYGTSYIAKIEGYLSMYKDGSLSAENAIKGILDYTVNTRRIMEVEQ